MSRAFRFNVSYTSSSGSEILLCTPESTKNKYLISQAESIKRTYARVLARVFGPITNSPGTQRLQYAFAAGCAGLSAEEWESLSQELKDKHREKFCRYYKPAITHSVDRNPPDIVIYLGGQPPKLPTSPSYNLGMESPKDDLNPWDDIWENAKTSADIPRAWGWHVRHDYAYNGASLIFLSGAFAIWPMQWVEEKILPIDSERLNFLLTAFLKVTLYHELTYATRSVAFGPSVVTPEKCVDDPRYTSHKHDKIYGEVGQLAEKLAFGLVLGLYMRNHDLYVYTLDEEKVPYEVPADMLDALFHEKLGALPLSLETIKQVSPQALTFIPPAERFKGKQHIDDCHVKIVSPIILPPPVPLLETLRPFPEDMAKQIIAQEAARQPCIQP